MATYVPPRDAFELQVAVTIGDILGREAIGVFDDVREVVVDRDRASEALARLTHLLGRRLSEPAVRRCRTIEQLAAAYRATPRQEPWSSLVTMRRRAAGSRVLVLVHPLGGNAFWYLNLARLLGGAVGVYAVHARGLDLAEAPQRDISAMARSYLAEVRAEIPDGAYAFAGWSFGGFVAAEMDRQLQAETRRVPLLVLFDVGPSNAPRPAATADAALGLLIHALRQDNASAEIMRLAPDERLVAILRNARRRATVPPGFTTAELARMLELNELHLSAMADYRFSPTAADVLLFRATVGVEAGGRALGWERLSAGEVHVHPLSGTHFEVLDRVHHDAIARRLRAALALRDRAPAFVAHEAR